LYAFLIALIKKTRDSHIFKEHIPLLYVSFIKFSINRFVKNFHPPLTLEEIGLTHANVAWPPFWVEFKLFGLHNYIITIKHNAKPLHMDTSND